MAPRWLLLVYRIPREPTAGRVFIWRKLKQLGAIALQDAAWVLPHTPRNQEQFHWLSSEITELNGEAHLWEADQLYSTEPDSLQRQFVDLVEAEYKSILAELKKKGHDLETLSKMYQAAASRDFFGSKLGRKVRDKLIAMSGG